MAPTSGYFDVKQAFAGTNLAQTGRHLPYRSTGKVVNRINLIHRDDFKLAFVNHRLRALAIFLIGLKDENNRPVGITLCCQRRGGIQQHSHVAVMAAGMHHIGVAGLVFKVISFRDWQSIHVGSQTDHTAAAAITQNPDNPKALVNLKPKITQEFGDSGFGPRFGKAKL
jgi:hypothetical protein